MSDVEAVVQVAVGGRAFTQMVEGEKRFDIVLRLPKDQRDDPEVIGRIPVDTPGQDGKPGARIPAQAAGRRSTRTSRARRTSTARTTAATSRSSSACRAATWPRRSPKPSER